MKHGSDNRVGTSLTPLRDPRFFSLEFEDSLRDLLSPLPLSPRSRSAPATPREQREHLIQILTEALEISKSVDLFLEGDRDSEIEEVEVEETGEDDNAELQNKESEDTEQENAQFPASSQSTSQDDTTRRT